MKRFYKIIPLILTAIILVLSLCGCGADEVASKSKSSNDFSGEFLTNEEALYDNADIGSGSSAQTERKVIEYRGYTVETKTFDTFSEKLVSAVTESGGYIENMSSGAGNKYSSLRNADFKVRIPSKKKNDFDGFLSENGNITYKTISTDDVTENYIDTESRIKALELEKETLENILKNTTSVNETITVYDKLTSVITSIESCKKILENYDGLIEYTTFNITVIEVEVETTETETSWFARTFKGLGNNFITVGHGILDFFSFMIRAIPYFIIIGIIAAAVILIIKGIKKRKRRKKARLQNTDRP